MKTLTIDPMNVPRSGGGVPGSEGVTAAKGATDPAATDERERSVRSSPPTFATVAIVRGVGAAVMAE
jgi:hypothetical protein